MLIATKRLVQISRDVSIETFRTSIKNIFIKEASLGLLTSALYYLLFLHILTKFCKIVYVFICTTLDRMRSLPGRYIWRAKGWKVARLDFQIVNCGLHSFRHQSFIYS